ncbi:MAG: hypothetical protein JWL77_6926 [Chthonomonadaceae bacterium]|nr:hypothetical protein [Chthonomonadaceae bacterium]
MRAQQIIKAPPGEDEDYAPPSARTLTRTVAGVGACARHFAIVWPRAVSRRAAAS